MASFILHLLPLWRWLKSLLTAYPWQIGFALALAWGAWEHKQHTGWRDYAKSLERGGKTNVTTLKAAKAKVEAKHATITGDTNHDTPRNRAAALAAGNAYAASHRVRWPSEASTARDASGGVPSPAATAGSVDANPTGPDMVAITRADFDTCTIVRSDLNTAVEWARKTWAVKGE